MNKYIILELIPTSSDPKKGDIIQLSALKIDNLKLIDRFDYRLKDEYIPLSDLLEMISYDKDKFIYKDTKEEILDDFKIFIEDIPLLILNNGYTLNYLEGINNIKKDISDFIGIPFSNNIIENIMEKYKLEPSNYIVDLLYEALIYSENEEEK